MLKVTKVQPIATHRDCTRKDKGNFQEIYGKTQENCGILYAQAIILGDYRAAEEALKHYHGSMAELHADSIVIILFVRRIHLALAMGRKPHFLQSDIIQSYKQTTVFR